MITGIGTALVEIARVQKAIGRSAFLEKVYTEKERELIAARSVRAAGNFAAKEAVAKALGCGFAGIAPAEIEVLRESSGMPYVVLHGRAKEKAEAQGVTRIQVSITDTAEYAQAYVVCEGEQEASCAVEGRRQRNISENGNGRKTVLREAALPVVDAAGMKEVDRYTIEEIGIPSLVLMERAALAVTDCVKDYATKQSRIGVLCGTGNNGGDGVAVARLLTEAGYEATVLVKNADESGTPEFLQQIKIAKAYRVPIREPWETKEYDIIVDALFGIGLSKPVEGEYAALLEQINKEEHIVIAVDIASGVSASDGTVTGAALYADETVTFGAAKRGHLLYPGKEYTGKLTVADIGFPKDVLRAKRQGLCLGQKEAEALLPVRPAYSNKGTFGKVAVIAGSKNMAGAAYFAACAAYRTGVGLVKVVTPECNREVLQTLLPEATVTTYSGKEGLSEVVEEAVRFADALVIGPGLGQSEEAKCLVSLVREALAESKEKAPVSVWDADALNIIAERIQQDGAVSVAERLAALEAWLPKKSVITPHPGELSRLLGITVAELTSNFVRTANYVMSQNEVTYVLKDAVTLTINNGDVCFNTTGNHGMATGGSGDVLCGVIAALAAEGTDVFTAAAVGVWMHGAAGDAASRQVGAASMIARDLLQAIGALFEEKRKEEGNDDGV